jgi:hypothetical protein
MDSIQSTGNMRDRPRFVIQISEKTSNFLKLRAMLKQKLAEFTPAYASFLLA